MHQLGEREPQGVEVDDVGVTEQAGNERAAIAETVERGGLRGHLVRDELER